MTDMTEEYAPDRTVALRAVQGFHGLSKDDIIHVDPENPHFLALMDLGVLVYAYPEDDPAAQATVLQVSEQGDETTILGVRPARQRRLSRKDASPIEADDGEADPE
jgi:hypothetical protein